MTHLFKDRYKIGLFLAIGFLVGIVLSIYNVYSLPHNLMLASGYQPELTKTLIILGSTFVVGGIAIGYALKYKDEVIVFRDKQHDLTTSEREASEANLSTISLDSVKTSIQQAKNEKQILQNGLNAICKQLEAGQGILYLAAEKEGKRTMELIIGYALAIGESSVISYEIGEGLVGQTAITGKTIYINDIPEGYIKIISGLGSTSPRYLLLVPMKKGSAVAGVIELASFTAITDDQRRFVEESAQLITDNIKQLIV